MASQHTMLRVTVVLGSMLHIAALTVVQNLTAEEAQRIVEEDGESKEKVLVQEEGHHACYTQVGPAAMDQQQSF